MEGNERKRKMKEGGQGMNAIEKTRWEGDKTVGKESEDRDEKTNE